MATNYTVNKNEYRYVEALKYVIKHGEERNDRTGVGTKAVFGMNLKFDLQHSFPALVGKSIHMKSVIGELLWFLTGSTNIKSMKDNGIRIWNEWADKDGEVGKLYGYQWRNWEKYDAEIEVTTHIDQLKQAIDALKYNPTSRRIVVSAWNPANADEQNLPPCHILYQFYLTNNNTLDCMMYQRSADMFLGVPFDIASYAILTHLVAREICAIPGVLKMTLGDCHIYNNHTKQVAEYLDRVEHIDLYQLPKIKFNTTNTVIDNYKIDDISLTNYKPLPPIKAKVAV